jgi:hypothetical protein
MISHNVSIDPDVVASLIATDKAMQRTFLTKDAATLGAILSNDYLLVASNGQEFTKAQVLSEMKSADCHWDINQTSDWEVRVRGTVAVVVAILHQKGSSHGAAFDNRVKFSDTYVLENGRWLNFHAHASRLDETTA